MAKQDVKTDKGLTVVPMIHKGLKEPQNMPIAQAQALLVMKNNGGWNLL